MYNQHFYCVIMAGGIGSRFWPVSRKQRPKQFLNFSQSGKSFLRLAYDRLAGIIRRENVLVVSLACYREDVLAEIPELEARNLLLEPYNRNTAPCIAYATYEILRRDPQATVVVMPADQVIDDCDLYRETVRNALLYASAHDVLVTIGVVPTRPDSNFGYIQTAEPMPDGPVKVKTFTEKPDKELAQVFLDSGEFLWNTGIFIWKAALIADQLARYAPLVASLWRGWEQALGSPGERSFIERIYTDMPRTSIDYAVMEKSDAVVTYPASFGWADIGNWDSFYEYLAGVDADGNAVRVPGKCLQEGNHRTLLYATRPDKLVAVSGLEDFIVLDTEDVLLICPRDSARIKDFVSELASPEYEAFR
ncbi:MAG: mannose-1-phosphate guanylyltransferase [Bacteroidales bacterium]|nr:mannose-1-phosphate guanylyltransferase [Bacteroidales bacterium]